MRGSKSHAKHSLTFCIIKQPTQNNSANIQLQILLKGQIYKMTKLTFLPHEDLCPEGAIIEAEPGISICDAALDNGIEIEHVCEKSCACTTCHVYVREGLDSLNEIEEEEDDLLDKAWGLEPDSRLSCQSIVSNEDLVIEIPKYTINMVSENH